LENGLCGDVKIALKRRDPALERFDTGLAANAATRRYHEIAFEPFAQRRRRHVENYIEHVGLVASLGVADSTNFADFCKARDKSFSEEKSCNQLLVVTGRAHRDCEMTARKANLEG